MNTAPAAKPSPCELSIDRPGEDVLVLQFAGNWRIGEDLPPVDKVLKQIDSNPGLNAFLLIPEGSRAGTAVF